MDGFQYTNGNLDFFPTAEGYVKVLSGFGISAYKYVFNYKDHLGNVRLSYSDSDLNGAINPATEIIEESNYYPFGLEQKGYNNVVSSNGNSVASKFKYNGIELEESLGLNLYEMDFRSYDPAIARFTGIDPVTHHSMSTYTAFDNNPVFWTDPSGADTTLSGLDAQTYFGRLKDYITSKPKNYADPDGALDTSVQGPSGDYFDKQGNHLGNDRIDDAKIYMVKGTSKFNINNFKEGGKYFENQMEYSENNGQGFSVTEEGLDSEIGTLARVGYAEFRGSNSTEQKVGMDITANRVDSNKYPNTLDGVIEAPYQFSSLNAGDPNGSFYRDPASTLTNSPNRNAWIKSVSNAISISNGDSRGISQGATLYYSPMSMRPRNSKPKWNFKILTEITVPGVRSSHLKLFKE